jgi:hypothetical protein
MLSLAVLGDLVEMHGMSENRSRNRGWESVPVGRLLHATKSEDAS